MAMTARERELLERVRDGNPMFTNQNVQDPAEHTRLEALRQELLRLGGGRWVELHGMREQMTRHNAWYNLGPTLTDEGRAALKDG